MSKRDARWPETTATGPNQLKAGELEDWGEWVRELQRLASMAPPNYFFCFCVSDMERRLTEVGNLVVLSNAPEMRLVDGYLRAIVGIPSGDIQKVAFRRAGKA